MKIINAILLHSKKIIGLSVLVASNFIVSKVSAIPGVNTTLYGGGKAVQTIATLDQSLYENVTAAFGGNVSNATPTVLAPNLGMVIYDSLHVYINLLGQPGMAMIISIPFIASWIVTGTILVPSVMGMVLSVWIYSMMGAQWALFSTGVFILSFVALIYTLYKS